MEAYTHTLARVRSFEIESVKRAFIVLDTQLVFFNFSFSLSLSFRNQPSSFMLLPGNHFKAIFGSIDAHIKSPIDKFNLAKCGIHQTTDSLLLLFFKFSKWNEPKGLQPTNTGLMMELAGFDFVSVNYVCCAYVKRLRWVKSKQSQSLCHTIRTMFFYVFQSTVTICLRWTFNALFRRFKSITVFDFVPAFSFFATRKTCTNVHTTRFDMIEM